MFNAETIVSAHPRAGTRGVRQHPRRYLTREPIRAGNLETCPSCGWVSFASDRRRRCEFCGGPRRPKWTAKGPGELDSLAAPEPVPADTPVAVVSPGHGEVD